MVTPTIKAQRVTQSHAGTRRSCHYPTPCPARCAPVAPGVDTAHRGAKAIVASIPGALFSTPGPDRTPKPSHALRWRMRELEMHNGRVYLAGVCGIEEPEDDDEEEVDDGD